jgi:hypothetical protein
MKSEGKKTCAYLTVHYRDLFFYTGYTVGCELKRGDITYFIYSLFLPSSDFKGTTDVLRYMIQTILNEIDDEEDNIIFYSPLDQFYQAHKLSKIAEPYKRGRNVRFFRRWYLPSTTLELESDAADRGYSITERLD